MSEGWWIVEDMTGARVPKFLWSWLTETRSLTNRLKSCCEGEFDLVVLGEHDIELSVEDAAVMCLETGAPARERSVQLRCGGIPCIQARSLLPHATLAGAGRSLVDLGDHPLGDVLFAHPEMTREPIMITDTPRWGRRSVFRLAGEPVLVSEWFLEGLQKCAR